MRTRRGNNKDQVKLRYLLHEALTETTIAQPIMLSYPLPISILSPGGIDHNNTPVSGFMSL